MSPLRSCCIVYVYRCVFLPRAAFPGLPFRALNKDGYVFVDGEHSRHELRLGDELDVSADAPPLLLYAK